MPDNGAETGYHGLNSDSKGEDWKELKADYHESGDSRGEVLLIDGHPVMEQWEKPYMEKLAQTACQKGGKVLEVGFGLGLSASQVQKHKIEEHIIIEANAGVIERGQKWAESQPNKVTFLHGLWQDKVSELEDGSLDAVLYDPYPMNSEEQHIHQFKFIEMVRTKLRPGGILTYCNLTSIGVLKGRHKEWADLWKETQVPHIEKAGYTKYSFTTFPIVAPKECDYYAGHTEALVPLLEIPN